MAVSGMANLAITKARIVTPGGVIEGALRCEGGRLRLVWPAARPGPVRIITTSAETSRTGMAAPEGGLQILFEARDPLLDAIAFSRGRFVLQGGGAELVLPAWPELSRAIEDCRPGSGG